MKNDVKVSPFTTGDINDNVTPEFRKAERDAIMQGIPFSQVYLIHSGKIISWTCVNW